MAAIKTSLPAKDANTTLRYMAMVDESGGANTLGPFDPVVVLSDSLGNLYTNTNPLFVGIANTTVTFSKLQDGSGANLTSTSAALDVNIKTSALVSNTTLNVGNNVIGFVKLTDSAGANVLSSNNALNVNIISGGGSSSGNTTLNASNTIIGQVKILDSANNGITSTASALDINIKTSSINSANASNQALEITALNILHTDMITAIPAGNNIIGSVLGRTSSIIAQSNVTAASAYTSGNIVGGLLTFANAFDAAKSGFVQDVTLKSTSVQTASFVLYLFKSNPANTTWTDKTTVTINPTDIPSLVAAVPLSSPYSGLVTHSLYNTTSIAKPVVTSNSNLYGILVTTGTPTFTTTSDLSVEIVTIKD